MGDYNQSDCINNGCFASIYIEKNVVEAGDLSASDNANIYSFPTSPQTSDPHLLFTPFFFISLFFIFLYSLFDENRFHHHSSYDNIAKNSSYDNIANSFPFIKCMNVNVWH